MLYLLICLSGCNVLYSLAFVVKTRKDARRMAMMESISAIKARVQELEGFVKDQGGRKDEYAAIMSQQSEGE